MPRRKSESTPAKTSEIDGDVTITPSKKTKVSTVVSNALVTFAESNKEMVASVKAVLERRSDDPDRDAQMALLIKTQQDLIQNLSERNGILAAAAVGGTVGADGKPMVGAKHPTQSTGHVLGEATSGVSAQDEGNSHSVGYIFPSFTY